MANLNPNINPIPNPLPEAAGKYFAVINARMPAAEKKVRIEAEKRLPPDVQDSIKNYRDLIEKNERTIQANPTKPNARALLKQQNTIAQKGIDTLLSKYGFIKHYADIQQEKRSARAEKRKRLREPDTLQVPSDTDMMKASEEADAAIAAADELLEEPANEVLPITESITAPVTPQAPEIMPPSPPITTASVTATATEQAQPPTETASANANKLAKILVDSLLFASQASTEPPMSVKDAEADTPATFNVTTKPQPASVANLPDAAVAETIVNALDESRDAVELQPQSDSTIEPGALANVIVNALKLASTTPLQSPVPEQAQVPEQVQSQVPEQVQSQVPSILSSALANIVVNALKQAPTEQVTATTTEPINTGDKCNESPGFIALIQKYLEPIIGQFSPPETKPQKVFDIEQLPKDMQRILDDANIKYIGRYRTDSKPGKNESTKDAVPQTTYLFWDTSNHDYISHTLTDVVNDIPVEKARAPSRSRVAKTIPAVTSNELVEKLPLPPRTMPVKQSQKDPLDKKRRIGETNKSAVSFDNMI